MSTNPKRKQSRISKNIKEKRELNSENKLIHMQIGRAVDSLADQINKLLSAGMKAERNQVIYRRVMNDTVKDQIVFNESGNVDFVWYEQQLDACSSFFRFLYLLSQPEK